jgi:fatty acid CoA ligase FadD9
MQQFGARSHSGFETDNTINPHFDDGVSLDSFVDWIDGGGYSVQRVDDYATWLQRFIGKLRQLSDDQRQHSAINILGGFAAPSSTKLQPVQSQKFGSAIQTLAAGPAIPHLTETFIHKFLGDMRSLGLLLEQGAAPASDRTPARANG